MCRLLGIIANKEVDFNFSLTGAHRSLESQSAQNPNGWGVAMHEVWGWRIKKEPRCAQGDWLFAETAVKGRGEILIAQVRVATQGGHTRDNTHPFQIGEWVFAHNGTIHEKEKLLRLATPRLRAQIEGETDSERYFLALLSSLSIQNVNSEAGGERLASALTHTIEKKIITLQSDGLNFLLSNGRELFAFRYGRPFFYLERDPLVESSDVFLSKETGALLESKRIKNERAVVLASEKVTEDENWVEMPERTLFWIDRQLYIGKRRMAE